MAVVKLDPNQIPSITGSSAIDSLIRSGLIAAATAISVWIIAWLNAHGFVTDPNLLVVVSGAVLSALVAIVTALWGYLNAQLTKQFVVQQTAHAAVTGEIPPAVTKISDEKTITEALNTAALEQAKKEGAL